MNKYYYFKVVQIMSPSGWIDNSKEYETNSYGMPFEFMEYPKIDGVHKRNISMPRHIERELIMSGNQTRIVSRKRLN